MNKHNSSVRFMSAFTNINNRKYKDSELIYRNMIKNNQKTVMFIIRYNNLDLEFATIHSKLCN